MGKFDFNIDRFVRRFLPSFLGNPVLKDGDFTKITDSSLEGQHISHIILARKGDYKENTFLGTDMVIFLNAPSMSKADVEKAIRTQLNLDSYQILDIIVPSIEDITVDAVRKNLIAGAKDIKIAEDGDNEELIAWVKALLKPIDTVNVFFANFREFIRIEIVNSQIPRFEFGLNMRFPNPGDLIFIDNIIDGAFPPFSWFQSEVSFPTLGNSKFISEGGEPIFYSRFISEIVNSPHVDFIVWVPDTVPIDLVQVGIYVAQHKLAGKLYDVKLYTPP